jgi:hypothetical protein
MTGLKEINISVADLIKAAFVGLPILITVGSAIWYFSAWSAKVDLRLDDMDRDLKQLHEIVERQGTPSRRSGGYALPHIPVDNRRGAS